MVLILPVMTTTKKNVAYSKKKGNIKEKEGEAGKCIVSDFHVFRR